MFQKKSQIIAILFFYVKYFSYIYYVIVGDATNANLNDMGKRYYGNRYENGYAEKIGYWKYKLNKAIEALDAEGIEFATARLTYFVKRQVEVYGRLENIYE